MAERLVLHVGLMKSGTTFVQGRCNANRERLAAQGILFPGPSWARQVHAVADFLEMAHARPGKWAACARRSRLTRAPRSCPWSTSGRSGRCASSSWPRVPGDRADRGRHAARPRPQRARHVAGERQEPQDLDLGGVRPRRRARGRRGRPDFWNQQGAAPGPPALGRGRQRRPRHRWSRCRPRARPRSCCGSASRRRPGIKPDAWDDAPRANKSLGAASAVLMRRLNDASSPACPAVTTPAG